jgi:hypothetical protein
MRKKPSLAAHYYPLFLLFLTNISYSIVSFLYLITLPASSSSSSCHTHPFLAPRPSPFFLLFFLSLSSFSSYFFLLFNIFLLILVLFLCFYSFSFILFNILTCTVVISEYERVKIITAKEHLLISADTAY